MNPAEHAAPFCFDDAVDLQIELLSARPSHEGESAYPWPMLTSAGHFETRRFRSVGLQNDFLSLQFIPALGGRLLSATWRPTGESILSIPSRLQCREGSVRGMDLPFGLRWQYGRHARKNDLGGVDSRPILADEASGEAGFWMADVCGGEPLGFHVAFSLDQDTAVLVADFRLQNRSFEAQPYDFTLPIPVGFEARRSPKGVVFHSASGSVLIESDEPLWNLTDSGLVRTLRELSPRQVDSFRLRLEFLPIAVTQTSSELAIGVDAEAFRIHSRNFSGDGKVVLRTPNGSVEAPISLIPNQSIVWSSSQLPSFSDWAVLDADGRTLLSSEHEVTHTIASHERVALGGRVDWFDCDALFAQAHDPRLAAAARIALAATFAREGNFLSAVEWLDEALSLNAADGLAWWAKAAYLRNAGAEGGEEAMLNAHYLAPLEPILRAEAILAQPEPSDGNQPNPILEPLAAQPEWLVDPAVRLMEAGLLMDASRYILEALRHADLRILRLMLADLYLQNSRMAVEASQQILAAQRAERVPEPWQPVELAVLTRLRTRFPDQVL